MPVITEILWSNSGNLGLVAPAAKNFFWLQILDYSTCCVFDFSASSHAHQTMLALAEWKASSSSFGFECEIREARSDKSDRDSREMETYSSVMALEYMWSSSSSALSAKSHQPRIKAGSN